MCKVPACHKKMLDLYKENRRAEIVALTNHLSKIHPELNEQREKAKNEIKERKMEQREKAKNRIKEKRKMAKNEELSVNREIPEMIQQGL